MKGRWGAGGAVVRAVDSPQDAAKAAEALGLPVLVESFIEGDLVNTPALYEEGRLVAAMACRKLEPIRTHGPSSVSELLVVDERLRAMCERIGEVFGLTGFASADVFLVDDGAPVILEVNPRAVPQLHLGKTAGVDMARAFADVIAGRWDGAPRLANRTATVRLFPQNLIRHRELHGPGPGTKSWSATTGALRDVPWDDIGLLVHDVREFSPKKR